MDWFSWLSKSSLDPSLIYRYGLMFSNNELELADVAYFNHEFLQSMGVSIAKHRLEILKLAGRETGSRPMSRIVVAIKRTKRQFSKYLRTWIRCEESALAIVPAGSYNARWKNAVIKKNRRMVLGNNNNNSSSSSNRHHQAKTAPLLLTNGSPLVFPSSRINSFSSPGAFTSQIHDDDNRFNEEMDDYWCPVVEEIRWDSLFQNLKPT